MSGLVGVTEAAKAVGLNKWTLYRLASKGAIPCYRAGKALRLDPIELREWMRNQALSAVDLNQA